MVEGKPVVVKSPVPAGGPVARPTAARQADSAIKSGHSVPAIPSRSNDGVRARCPERVRRQLLRADQVNGGDIGSFVQV